MHKYRFAFQNEVYHAGEAVYNRASNSDVMPFAMRDYILYRWIGVWLFLLPFLGIPGSWKETLLILTAFFIVAYSFLKRRNTEDTVGSEDNSASKEHAGDSHSPRTASATRANVAS